MINPTKTFTITVDETFVAFIIMFDSTTSKTFEFVSFITFLCCKKSFRGFASCHSISMFFEGFSKLIIILSMILQLLISSNKQFSLFLISLLLSFNKNVFKDAFL